MADSEQVGASPNASTTGAFPGASGTSSSNPSLTVNENPETVRKLSTPFYGENNTTWGNAPSIFQLRNPFGVSSSGALPDRFDSTVTLSGFKALISTMSAEEKLNLRNKFYSAGYYEADMDKLNSSISWSVADDEALQKGLTNFFNTLETNPNLSFDDFLSNEIGNNQRKIRGGIKGSIESTQDFLQNAALKYLDREFTQDELDELTSYVFGVKIQGTDIYTNMPLQGVAKNESGVPIVQGGGPNSSAIQVGRNLASAYQVQIVNDFNMDPESIGVPSSNQGLYNAVQQGRAIKVAGDSRRLSSFVEWANQQKGSKEDNRLVEDVVYVGDKSTGIEYAYIVFNDGVDAPVGFNLDYSAATSNTDFDKFMGSMRRPGDIYAYTDWNGEGANRRGAYGISDDKWSQYSKALGIDVTDYSTNAQDRVAGAWIRDLWNKYQDWNLVAVAARIDEGAADRVRSANGDLSVLSEEDRTWVQQTIQKMPLWKPTFDTAMISQQDEDWSKYSLENPYGMNVGVNGMTVMDLIANLNTDDIDSSTAQALQLRAEKIFRESQRYNIPSAQIFSNFVANSLKAGANITLKGQQ